MARIIAEHSSNPTEDRWAIGEFLAINYIAGAPDGHSKNVSLALWPDDIHVAPLYALATAFPYDQRNHPSRLRHAVRDLASNFPDAFADALA